MRDLFRHPRGERGIALVLAMLVLLVLSFFAVMIMMSMGAQTRITGNDSRRARALALADAGVAEAVSRLRAGDVPAALNPRAVTQIFNVASGSVPALGTDSTGLATRQPSGQVLDYTTTAPGPGALTIGFRTNPSRTVIYRYDSALNPAINTASGPPIFQITSTGKVGNTSRTVMVDVVSRPPTFNAKGALTAGGEINVHNGIFVCGHNHSAATTDFTAINVGRSAAPGANPGADAGHTSCLGYEVGASSQAGAWAGGTAAVDPPSYATGTPATSSGGAASRYTGPWDALGMSQADYLQWMPVRRSTVPTNWNGSFNLDKDATFNNNQGGNQSWTLNNVNGSGFLYIDGHVILQGDFVWRGMVYINGQVETQGRIWVLGTMIGQGQIEVQGSGSGGAILYSRDAVDYYLSMYAGSYQRIAWRELN
ncbi:MAG: hypothetical protein HZA61_05850 [Candidatus Eisenbacteria bacterium]|uniref:Type 4 fimbrial biogenesis protein PilX N-terminal domain-containing protein n=1 Tax=Eiseniibacteriota bacterium TaxID=2212470 RepID=A0A933WA51_UNCEI|nr:hypothetical protein [Candidatus Eisenbacteria bacterium]